ncbi:site-specific DNA-methyltransferase [Protaetiibacter sp. SSC-01]|uniref:site-specific DNA-methyltransferase n=1 Tax=Protaetiibacter sp. SSC-01 TaxID=2759943 RepID=UPI0016572ED9|nr:site-specific DNA-methyltransferase [Protaetiibacter sp. SSC-01]QNO37189.1 site-specific DNA-methyltransferase [Protaetiibacter sp. SSC-01]
MSGRLTLSWANKEKALISDGAGGYRWVDPDDWRAREVRLLDPVSLVGDATGAPTDNLLIRGDGLDAMRSLARIPEYADVYRGKVKLVYIDPPFNTGQAFEHYDDALEHSVWLSMMRQRLEAIRDLLAPDGSVWVHLDDAELAYCKVLMDEVFGRSAYVATIVWQKTHTRENRTAISTSNDSILVYAPYGSDWKAVRNVLPSTDEQLARYSNPDHDPRGPWQSTPMHAKAEKGRRSAQFYTIVSPSGRPIDPPPGRCWLFTRDRYEEMLADNRITFGAGDGVPRIKKFLAEVQAGLVPNTWWTHAEVGTTGTGKAELVAMFPGAVPFSTPKPERLIERVIQVGSNPGDIVLDAFAGSGTTAAVAHKMRRRWVTVEQQESTVQSFTRPRLQKVVDGADAGGVTGSTGWLGGGGFTEIRVAQPVVQVVQSEQQTATVVDLSAEPGRLERSVAAQLGYRLDADPAIDHAQLIGTKGRSRLAVVRGVADEGLVSSLVSALGDDELLLLAAPMVAPGAREALRAAAPGSRIVRYPSGLEVSGVGR